MASGILQIGSVRRVVETRLPTKWGAFRLVAFEREVLNGTRRVETALALIMGDVTDGAPGARRARSAPLVRVHSQCFTGEMLGSIRCDCAQQLEIAMRAIAREGRGVVIYEHQEGRGVGLREKLRAYALQDAGLDTVEANEALGYPADCRDFTLPAAILRELGVTRVRLLTNNPQKVRALVDGGIDVVERVACESAPTADSLRYLRTKKQKLGHALSLDDAGETDEPVEFESIEAAISELTRGRMIVVVDDEDRENEGDLVMAADAITPEAINFMATHGRGLICLAMTEERLDELRLAPMAADNTALHDTAFTVSIDWIGDGVTTGISAHDRAATIQAAIDPRSRPEDFARPGHVFPLRARRGGVLVRRGQTEAAVDLARLSGLTPAGVICEIVNDDGTMARVPDLARFCKKHQLIMITVADLARYRLESGSDDGDYGAVELLAAAAGA